MHHFLQSLEKNTIFHKYFDYYVAILLGIATVITATAAYQGSLWSGNAVSNYNKSISEITDANSLYLEYLNNYSHTEIVDLKDDILYLEWKKTSPNDPDKDYLFSRLSEGLQNDLKNNTQQGSVEIEEKEKRDKEIGTIYKESEQTFTQSAKNMKKAEEANANGDKFTFITVLFAIVLFFGGLSTTTNHFRLKALYIFLATLIFLYSFLRYITLPFPS